MSKLEKPRLQEAYKLWHQGTLALSYVEQQGMRINVPHLQNKKQEITEVIEKENTKFKSSDFYKEWKQFRKGEEPNYNSPKQLKDFLYGHKKLEPPKYTDTGKKEMKEQGFSDNGSTDKEALKELNIKALNRVIYIKELHKIRDTYLENIEEEVVDGFIYPFFNLHIARTFRSSSSAPNSQNIPKRDKFAAEIVRSCFIPRDGHLLLEADFKSLEVVAGACVHQDPNMLSYLHEGGDMHKDIAKEVFFLTDKDVKEEGFSYLRSCVKNAFVFPQFYGDYYGSNARDICKWLELPRKRFLPGSGVEIGDVPIADHLRSVRSSNFPKGVRNFNELMNHLENMEEDLWINRFPTYAKWRREIWEQYKRDGYIDSLTGFRFKGLMKAKDTYNYPIQSIAFHMLLKSLIKTVNSFLKKENWKSKLIGQIHDSMIFDVHPSELDYLVDMVESITTRWLSKQWPWIIAPLNIEFEMSGINGNWFKMFKI